MKKILAFLAILVMSVFSVSAALYMSVSPDEVAIPEGGSVITQVTVLDKLGGNPVAGRALGLLQYCKELSGDPLTCNPGDEYNTTELSVAVGTPTNSTGQAEVLLTHNGPGVGTYHYTVCDKQTGTCEIGGASVTGDANVIPEFGVIGAGIVLAGAGLFVARRRKEN